MLTLCPCVAAKSNDPAEKLKTPENMCLRLGVVGAVHARALLVKREKNRMENRDLKWKFIFGELGE